MNKLEFTLKDFLKIQLGGICAGLVFGGAGRLTGGKAEILFPFIPALLTNGSAIALPGYALGVGLVHADKIYSIVQEILKYQ